DVHEPEAAPDGPRRDQHPLDEGVRVALQEVAVLEGPRLALVGVDHQVHRASVVLGDERPLGARGEAGSAETAKVRFLDLVHDGRRLHLPRALQGAVAAALAVGGERVRPGAIEVAGEDLLYRHGRASRGRSIFSGVRSISYRSST